MPDSQDIQIKDTFTYDKSKSNSFKQLVVILKCSMDMAQRHPCWTPAEGTGKLCHFLKDFQIPICLSKGLAL